MPFIKIQKAVSQEAAFFWKKSCYNKGFINRNSLSKDEGKVTSKHAHLQASKHRPLC